MRLDIRFESKVNRLPKEIHKFSLSLLKSIISEKDGGLYKEWYEERSGNTKSFSFALYIPIDSYENDQIVLKENRGTITFSTNNMEEGIRVYNAFNSIRGKAITVKGVDVKIAKVNVIKEKMIVNESIVVDFISPLLIREFLDDGKNARYLTGNDNNKMMKQLNESVAYQIKNLNPELELLVEKYPLEINTINSKKVVVKFYNQYIDGLKGSFQWSGHPKGLELL